MRGCWILLALLACGLPQLSSQAEADVQANSAVSLAPVAPLINGVDDIDAALGNCGAEIQQFCSDLTAGEGRLADCISDQISESESADSADGTGTVTDACREDVYQFKIQRNSNINLNVPLAKACKVDAEQYCNVTWFFGYKAGQVIGCLRDVKEQLAPACQKQVFKIQKDAAEDYRADAMLYEACKADAETLCKDVKLGGGRVQGCLHDNRMQLSWACEEQLFRQEVENADDVRLSVRLFTTCIKDKRKFCADVEPGSSRVKDCLEANRNEPTFSPDCKDEIDKMIEGRVREFRLDERLRRSCETDIYAMCAFFGDLDTIDNDDSSVIRCLQDYIKEITSPSCKQQVKKYQELAAQDVRFDVPLADACFEDRNSFCASVPPGSARVIRCLMKMREKLSPTCRAVLFDEEVRFSENIDFQFPMRKSCANEVKAYCSNIPHGEARVIRCLQDNQGQKDFSKECKAEVKAFELEQSSDYRLNYRLNKACTTDVDLLCSLACKKDEGQVCAGTVLRCLIDKRDLIKDDACKQEVFYFQKMEVTDYRNDVILAAACRADVEKHCASTEPGDGRIHECLRKNRQQLSEPCRKEELLLEELEAENVELRPGIMRVCKDERIMFCKGVVPGGARMFRCLAQKMGDPDFGEVCRAEVMQKLQRRQANWKLDPTLRKACKPAVQRLCLDVDNKGQEEGLVYKCLIKSFEDLDPSCQKELGRALHMALYVWQPGALLTHECDEDVKFFCLEARPNIGKTPGAVGTCLAAELEKQTNTPAPKTKAGETPVRLLVNVCRVLVDLAEAPDLKQAFDASLSVVLLQSQLKVMEGATGLSMIDRDRQGRARSVTLTGWTAIFGMAALVVLVIGAAGFGYRKYTGMPDIDYTLVVKKGPMRR